MKTTENSEMLVLVWDILEQYIKESSKQVALDHAISELIDNGHLDEADLASLKYLGNNHIKKAVKEHYEELEEEFDDEDDVV